MEKTFAKGLMLLETLVALEEPASVTRLANLLGLYKSNVHRLLQTLVACGYVVQTAEGRYTPSLRLVEMGGTVWRAVDLAALATPTLREIAAMSGHPAWLLVAEHGGLRVRAASGTGTGQAIALRGAGRMLGDLALRPVHQQATVLALDDAEGRHLCLATLPDFRLPAPAALGLVAADEGTAAGLASRCTALALGLAAALSGPGSPAEPATGTTAGTTAGTARETEADAPARPRVRATP